MARPAASTLPRRHERDIVNGMKNTTPVRSSFLKIAIAVLGVAIAAPAPAAQPEPGQRVLILRERTSLQLLEGAFTLELVKIRGYTIDVRIAGQKQKLKRGESFSPANGGCSVTFQKISPETRIARFLTDCP